MAAYWLDLVRYADTVGYHGDQDHRDVAVPRLRHRRVQRRTSRSTSSRVEQLAGDLLPNADDRAEDRIGLQPRCLQTTHEGGAQAEGVPGQVRRPTGCATCRRVWMGATVGCAECHDHKYDPYPQTGLLPLGGLLRRRGRGEADACTAAARTRTPTQAAAGDGRPRPDRERRPTRLDAARSPGRRRRTPKRPNCDVASGAEGARRHAASASEDDAATMVTRDRHAADGPRAAARQLAGRLAARSSSRPCRRSSAARREGPRPRGSTWRTG